MPDSQDADAEIEPTRAQHENARRIAGVLICGVLLAENADVRATHVLSAASGRILGSERLRGGPGGKFAKIIRRSVISAARIK